MFYISPKLLISGLSGIGLIAGGLAAWRLTNPVPLNKIPNLSPDQKQQAAEACGSNIWQGSSNVDSNTKNEKDINYYDYDNCITEKNLEILRSNKK